MNTPSPNPQFGLDPITKPANPILFTKAWLSDQLNKAKGQSLMTVRSDIRDYTAKLNEAIQLAVESWSRPNREEYIDEETFARDYANWKKFREIIKQLEG